MADHPLATLARIVGGVALMHGRLGHQVLGQLLVAGEGDVAIAAASVVIAATSREPNAVAQVAIRTAVPALAVRSLLHRTEQRLARREQLLDRREQEWKDERENLVGRIESLEAASSALQLENRRLGSAAARATTALGHSERRRRRRRRHH